MKIIKDKKIVMIILSIILVIIVMSSTTYALFFKTHTFDNTESYTAGILDITVEEGSKLSLADTLPMTDEEGSKTTPYTFTITNNGNISYTFDLKMLSTTTSNQINSKYIKVKLDDNEPVLLSSISSGIIADDLKLDPGKSVTMSVRIWLDISTPNTEIGKKFSAKIVTDGVGSEYVPPGAIVIKQIFDNSVKTTVTDNNQNYEYAKDIFGTDKGGMMKDVGDNIRYYGPNPNNYVSFNNELWRIIGVFNDIDDGTGKKEIRLKIVRNDYSNSVQWSVNGTSEWATSSLKDLLNLDTSGNFYYTMTQESKNMISDAVWHLGAANSFNSGYKYADEYYNGERKILSSSSDLWQGKIGLIYLSDFMYSSDLSVCNDGGWGSNSSCVDMSWIIEDYEQWTITPIGSNMYGNILWPYGNFCGGQSEQYSSANYKPVVYLKSSVMITGGDGTEGNPYTLGISDMPQAPVTATDTITSIFTSADKTTVTNNSVEYEYATSVGMMEDVGGNIRYYGANPNNYVKFNNELWRIIGVFKDIDDGTGKKETRLKIARSDSIGGYAWDNNNMNEWMTATLNTDLNGTYLNSLSSEAQEMAGNAKWNLGGSSTYSGLYADDYYTFERGTTVYYGRSTEWTGKIALMYPSDYMYAGDLSKCSKDGANWNADATNCRDTSWLRNTISTQWTLSPNSNDINNVFSVNNSGYIDYDYDRFTFTSATRPVLFLTSTVQITGGEGTQSNPYTLG